MKAIAVIPGKADSLHLAELRRPSLDEVPGERGVLVKGLDNWRPLFDTLKGAWGAIKVYSEIAEA